MRKILKIILCASLVLHTPFSVLRSQITHTAAGQQDEKASAVLKACAKRLGNVQCHVEMTALDGDKKETARYSADVRYKGSAYSLEMKDQQVLCDGKTVWHWNKAAREVTVNDLNADDEMNLLNPGRLLATYQKNFKAKYIRTENDGTAVVDLQPLSAQSYHKIRLFIVEKSGELRRLEVHKYDSGRENYVFSKYQYGKVKGSFTFDTQAHPEAEIIDMR